MPKEIVRINHEKDLNLRLNREDIFISTEHSAFTVVGSYLYGLFVIHKEVIREALNSRENLNNKNKVSEIRLQEMKGEETEQKYQDVEKIWGRKIPRDENTSNYLTEQINTIIFEHSTLLTNGLRQTKR